MKKALMLAAAIGFLAAPAFAQQTPGGQSSGGPARMGIPGEIQPGMKGGRRMTKQRMMKRKSMKRRAMRRR